MTIGDYPRLMRQGVGVSIPIELHRPANGSAIVQFKLDLTVDGEAGWTVGWGEALTRLLSQQEGVLLHWNTLNLDMITAAKIYPQRIGIWNLELSAVSEEGCVGSTGARRAVTVSPE